MTRCRLRLTAALLAILCAASTTQSMISGQPAQAAAQATQCPTIKLICPSNVAMDGSPATFFVDVSSADSPTYNWTLSAGIIAAGQGTSAISVDASRDPVGTKITATVKVGGLDPACQNAKGCTSLVTKKAQ